MRGMTEQIVVEKSDEGDKEKKKRRRPPRRNKPFSAVSGSAYNSVNTLNGEASECLENGEAPSSVNTCSNLPSTQNYGTNICASSDQGLSRASDVAFSSLPSMRIYPEGGAVLENIQVQHQFPPLEGTGFSRSCPVPMYHEESTEAFSNEQKLPFLENDLSADYGRRHFVPHWPLHVVDKAIEKGDVFKASFRVNVHNRIEAYCTIEGVPTDVLISGFSAQNRAVEGDIVAIKLDPLALWTRLKGAAANFDKIVPSVDCNTLPKLGPTVDEKCKGKEKLDIECERNQAFTSDPSNEYCDQHTTLISKSIQQICSIIASSPSKRPTGKVVAIIEKSPRRNAVVGFLGAKQLLSFNDRCNKDFIQLMPNDAKFPKLLVPMRSLPDCIMRRLGEGDPTVEMELVGAQVGEWSEYNLLPNAHIVRVFGQGGEIKSQIASILFENAICCDDFSPESLSCIPDVPWEVPKEELKRRLDLRNLCSFTIDSATAIDLDDALSIENLADGNFRVGIHIADVSYFVLPDTALDLEARTRSTSVYIRQHKLPMLPSLFTESVASLNPGTDRLTFSIMFDITLEGDILDRWICHTVIQSCCKLSYEHVQDIIDGCVDSEISDTSESEYPQVYGHFRLQDIIRSVKSLHEVSMRLKDNRFKDGALRLDSSKLFFSFDECGIPYDSSLSEQRDSNSLVEEFMLLTNRTAAEVISRAFPDCALLRKHPEPNARRLREFEAFWCKHGFELDTSSSGQFHLSLQRAREKLKDDPVLFDIFLSYASKPMQLASYFCTGDFKDQETEWAHYSLALPLYTHFTSPLRRYPDIVVHRTLVAALEAEDMYLQKHIALPNNGKLVARKCFTSLHFDKDIADSKECKEALSAVILKFKIPCAEIVAEVAAYSNQRKWASKHAEDASERLYLWALLKNKETLIAEARVLGLGPKFMSIYIHELAIERRIYYDEVDGLTVNWLETTSTLVLDLCRNKRFKRRGGPGKNRPLEEVACVINQSEFTTQLADYIVPENLKTSKETVTKDVNEINPSVFPLTVRLFSTIYVALHATGGNNGPLDIGARLYMSSYSV
ncbi:hypothetical protein Sjap_018749 [Stephania japonica]|uniref:DIS3-like exonuclease 2 n=1 Tax=Stephania japonica TaxID=461633 RepID=A0AAP0I8H9_9MAGN